MGTIASGSIDLKSLKVADEEVNKYITNIGDDGIKVHPYNNTIGTIDQNNYTKIDSSGMEIWQEDNDTSIKVAEFGVDGATIGKSDGSQSYLYEDYHSLKLIDKEGKVYFWVSDLRDKDDNYLATITERFIGDGVTETFSVNCSVNEEVSAIDSSHPSNTYLREYNQYTFNIAPNNGAIITITYKTQHHIAKAYTLGMRRSGTDIGALSLSEGIDTEASGTYSHSEGYGTTANMSCAHAEGSRTIASGIASHAEGTLTTALGDYSHAEGIGSVASGASSHAEGMNTVASGSQSHAGGDHTIAQGMYQTVIGMYNIPMGSSHQLDIGDPLFIIGNGFDDSNRSNAFAVDWSGNVDIASGAKYKINGTNLAPSDIGEADYVTHRGTSGAWAYRKWKSGKVEAWAYISFTSTTPAVWASPIRYIDKTFTIPSGIFASAPRMTGSSNSSQYWAVDVSASSSTAGSVRFCTVASSALTPYIQIYAWTN